MRSSDTARTLTLLLLLLAIAGMLGATGVAGESGVCSACSPVTLPLCDCPVGYSCVHPDGSPTDSYPQCTRTPAGFLSPVRGDRVRPLPCPTHSFCPYGLPIPLACPSTAVCSSSRAFIYLPLLLLLIAAVLVSLRRSLAAPLLALVRPSSGSPSSTAASDASADADSIPLTPAGARAPHGAHGSAAGIALELRGVDVVKSGRLILDGVTGTIPPGRMVAVIGPSGAGKTTFLSVLRGRVRASRGAMLVNGKRTSLASFKSVVGFVPQDDETIDPLLTPRMVYGVALGLKAPLATSWPSRSRAVRSTLADMMIEHVADVPVGSPRDPPGARTLSGGERKRVNVGLELVSRPLCLLCDESTTGLDEHSALQVVTCLRAASLTRGSTVVATIHQPTRAAFDIFDDVIVLAGGRVVYWGPVPEVYGAFGVDSPDGLLDAVSREPDSLADAWRESLLSTSSTRASATSAGVPPVSRSLPWPTSQFMVQFVRFAARVEADASTLVHIALAFAVAGAFLGLAFLGPKFILPPPEHILDSCPAAAAQLTNGQKWAQPCSSTWPTLEDQGLLCMYVCMALGVVASSYGVSSMGAWIPLFKREVASGASRLAFYAAATAWDTGLCGVYGAAFVAAYALVANPWGSLAHYSGLIIMLIWVFVGIGNLAAALLSRRNAAILATLAALVLGVFSGLPFQRTPVFTFYFSEALWRTETAIVLDNATPADLYWISVYASGNYGYHTDRAVYSNALAWMALYGSGARVLTLAVLFLRTWR